MTILLAEQGVEFSLSLADRVYVLEKGAVRHAGPGRRTARRQGFARAADGDLNHVSRSAIETRAYF
jgi:ABC-type branched-subunit amino acid transport system ATPase component